MNNIICQEYPNSELLDYTLSKLYNKHFELIGYQVNSYYIKQESICSILFNHNLIFRVNTLYSQAVDIVLKSKALGLSFSDITDELVKLSGKNKEKISYVILVEHKTHIEARDITRIALEITVRVEDKISTALLEGHSLLTAAGLFSSFMTTESTLDIRNINIDNVTSMYKSMDSSIAKEIIVGKHNTLKLTNLTLAFAFCDARQIDLSGLYTSNVITMKECFMACIYLKNVRLCDTSNVVDLSEIFDEAIRLESVSPFDVSSTETLESAFENTAIKHVSFLESHASNLTTTFRAFYNCKNLIEADLSKIYTSALRNCLAMFTSCVKLEKVDIRNIVLDEDASLTGMFAGCDKLEKVYVNQTTYNILCKAFEKSIYAFGRCNITSKNFEDIFEVVK